MTVFIDASFLIALFNKDDEFHQRAEETAEKLETDLVRFITSDIVVAETVNVIFRLKGPVLAEKFLGIFKKSKIEEFFVPPEIFTKAYARLFSQKSKRGLNFFDCLHLETAEFLSIKTILTFDEKLGKASVKNN